MEQEERPWILYILIPTKSGGLIWGGLYVQRSCAGRQGNQQLVPQRIMAKEYRLIDEEQPLMRRLLEGVIRL